MEFENYEFVPVRKSLRFVNVLRCGRLLLAGTKRLSDQASKNRIYEATMRALGTLPSFRSTVYGVPPLFCHKAFRHTVWQMINGNESVSKET
uniref:Uncharacterized protein n=1 Tax=Trichuris muris TaxID=70415 RepID=A0A5S6Q1T8_TRIMR